MILLQENDVRKNVLRRSQIIHACREILINSGNIEIETPILNDIFNGGYSEPYIVRNNNYRKDQYLRVSSELYLKQMIIGGIEGVFEIGKQFRGGDSENISRSEYTSLEFYRSYKDHFWMMEYIEKLFSEISRKVLNKYKIKWFENEVDISKEWKKITFYEAFKEYLGIDIYSLGKEDIKKLFTKNNIVEKDTDSMLLSLFKVTVAPHLKQPTFVYSYPAGISPYSKRNPDFNEQVLKFGGYISGKKIIDGSLEENDAIIVRKNLEKQREEKRKMGVKIYPEDSAFEEALNYGMPPLVGASISIDRMIMFFTESNNIREVNIF